MLLDGAAKVLAYDYDDLSQNTAIRAKFTTAGGAPTSLQDFAVYEYQGRFLTKRSVQTRYKYESTYATKDLFLQYRPEYDGQRFVTKVTNATRWGSAAASDHDELAQFTYAFDRSGNRLSNDRHRGTGGNAEGFSKMNQIDAYAYDTLHRLTKVDYNMSATTGDEIYVYDSLGNRVTYTDQRNATTRAYANNLANEYTSVATYAVTHDAAGNLWKQVVNGSGDAYVYAYDCDNRLLQVDYDPNSGSNTTVATFAYDALGRKITAWTQYDGTSDSQTADLRFYHDGQAEIADYHSDGTPARRFINGTQYVDERVALIEGEADEADTFYYLLQELFTVTGLVEKNGALAEADVYDGYGKVRLWDYSPGDFDRDGDVDATDQGTFVAAMGLGVNRLTEPFGFRHPIASQVFFAASTLFGDFQLTVSAKTTRRRRKREVMKRVTFGDPAPETLDCLLDWIPTPVQPEAPDDALVWYDVPLTFEPPAHSARFVIRQELRVGANGEVGIAKEPAQRATPRPPRPRADYGNSEYKKRRLQRLDHDHDLCVFCKSPGTTVQHVTYRHAGGEERLEELRSLCRLCHDAVTMIEYGLGMGLDRINPDDPHWRDRIITKRDEIIRFRSLETRRRRLSPEEV